MFSFGNLLTMLAEAVDEGLTLEDIKWAYILTAIEEFEGDNKKAAKALDVSYPTLMRMLRISKK